MAFTVEITGTLKQIMHQVQYMFISYKGTTNGWLYGIWHCISSSTSLDRVRARMSCMRTIFFTLQYGYLFSCCLVVDTVHIRGFVRLFVIPSIRPYLLCSNLSLGSLSSFNEGSFHNKLCWRKLGEFVNIDKDVIIS